MPACCCFCPRHVPCGPMRLLKKIAWVIGIMIVIAIIKFVLNRSSPASFLFHSNLLTSIQWFLFGGLMFWLVLHFISKAIRKKGFSFWWSWLIFLLLGIAGELSIYYFMRHADKVPKIVHGYLVKYYLMFERQLPEVKKDCACYDNELTYTYRPNAACLQSNPEFSDSIYVNKAGLRDDNASLEKPEIICLGDSYTMGWGVGQQQAYPQVLERTLKMKVLNAAVSSYGTAREAMLLKRLDTTALKYIIIQYCFNDIQENNVYVRRNRYRLPVMPKPVYQKAVTDHEWATTYYPLKRVLTLTRMTLKDGITKLSGGNPFADRIISYDTSYVPATARAFLDILHRSGINFKKVKVLVVDMNRYPYFDHHLMDAARQMLHIGAYSNEFRNSIRFINTSPLNNAIYYYPLDSHLTPKGHNILASILAHEISDDTSQ